MRRWLKQNHKSVYRQRGEGNTRLEQLSDGVIALAITLLLVSLEAPRTGDELITFAADFLAFALSTMVLFFIWGAHCQYFYRFGLIDRQINIINACLLIVALFFVYPLKFIISFLLSYTKFIILILLGLEYDKAAFIELVTLINSWEKLPLIMIIYSSGYFAIILCFALLYRHAYANKEELEFSDMEEAYTHSTLTKYWIQCGVSLLSIAIALGAYFSPMPSLAILAGVVYFLIGPLIYVFSKRSKGKLEPKTH